jgi:hypothetical protein
MAAVLRSREYQDRLDLPAQPELRELRVLLVRKDLPAIRVLQAIRVRPVIRARQGEE